MGWKLFPIAPGTKRPALEGDWRKHATDNEAQIEAWRDAGYDLGVDCGASGLFVIDIDGEEGEQSLLRLPPLPGTYVVRTRRGGRHLYFRGRGPNTVQRLGPKIDTRGDGGYVVWDAAGYDVLVETPPAIAPAWIVERLAVQRDRKPAVVDVEDLPANLARARAYLRDRAPAIEGQGGNDHTYQTAATLRDLGVSEDTSLELMLEGWNERCDPPWDADELAEVVAHAWEYGQNEPGAQAIAGDPRTRFLGVDHPGLLQPERSRYHLWTVAEALTLPEPSWLLPGIMPAEAVGVAYGPKDVGKTWLALDQALHLATGTAGYGREQSDPQDVIYFCGESFRDLVHHRINAWCVHREHARPRLERFYLLDAFPNVADDRDVDMLIDEVTKRKLNPALIVLDTYARVLAQAGLNENDPLDVMKFVRQAEDLKRGFEATILAIAHTGKDVTRGARGATTLVDAADFAYEITADWNARMLRLSCMHMKMAARFDPLHFEAIEVGNSLVVQGVTPDVYRKATAPADPYSSAAVGIALASLGAKGDANAVTAYVLAQELYTPDPDEPQEETLAACDRIARKLNQMGKGRLEQYVSRAGWRLPE